jgi:uncharacterized protein involved in exopolysaccharide biosynthesis
MATEPRRTEPDIGPAAQESELVQLLNAVLRNRTLVIFVPMVAAVTVLLLSMTRPRQYRSEAAIVPQQAQRLPAAFAGLATQLGLPIPGDRLDQSPAFYADLLKSREIMSHVVQEPLDASQLGEEQPVSLLEIYEIKDERPEARVQKAADRLRRSVRPTVDSETGVVAFSVPSRSATLSQAIAQEIIEQINEFNLRRRQSVAGAERTFVEDRLKTAMTELSGAEAQLRQFDERNLRIGNSPELRLERDRLVRQVDMRQQVVTMLAQAYEQARIDEVRNTPAITVIERPNLPLRGEPRGSVKNAIVAFIVVGFLGTMLAFGRELLTHVRTGQGGEYQEFRELKRRLKPRWLGRRRAEG